MYLPDKAIKIGEIDVSRRVDRDPFWSPDRGEGRVAVIAEETRRPLEGLPICFAGTRYRGDNALRIDHANAIVEAVRDIHIARGVHGDAGRGADLGENGGP